MNFVAPVPELGHHFPRQHLGIAACDIDVDVAVLHQSQHRVDESHFFRRIVEVRVWDFGAELDFVDEDIIAAGSVKGAFLDIGVQLEGVPVSDIVDFVQRQLDDLVLRDAVFQQIVFV